VAEEEASRRALRVSFSSPSRVREASKARRNSSSGPRSSLWSTPAGLNGVPTNATSIVATLTTEPYRGPGNLVAFSSDQPTPRTASIT
jgi:hypothetical protein